MCHIVFQFSPSNVQRSVISNEFEYHATVQLCHLLNLVAGAKKSNTNIRYFYEVHQN